MMKQGILLVTAIASCAGSGICLAQEMHPALTDTHTFRVGGYYQKSDTSIGARRADSGGDEIDLDDLGIDESSMTWMLGYRWRINDRWSLALGASQFDIDGRVQADKTFEFNGQEFEAGAMLESEFDLKTYMADVMYSVYKSDQAELLLGGGLHAFDYDIKFTGTLTLEDESLSQAVSADDLMAPLPNLRMRGFYAISPRWSIDATLGWMSANIDNWDGDYLYANVSTDYRITDRFGLGLGYQGVSVDVTHKGSRIDSSLDISYYGPTVYLEYGF